MERPHIVRLHDQSLQYIPANILEGQAIGSLQCPGNRLTDLPAKLRSHTATLTDLSLASNELAAIDPDIIGSCTALRALTLSENRLVELPPSVGNLTSLELLSLGGNSLTSLPSRLSECTSLRTLALSNNALVELPGAAFIGLNSLRTIRLDENPQLTSLPPELCNLPKLEALSVARCALTTLPESIGSVSTLSTLQARDNRLAYLPDSIGQLQRLRTLALEGNRLHSLPTTIISCHMLRTLTLSVNRLLTLPPLDGLTSLQELRIDDNPITCLPELLPPNLRVLGLSVCQKVTSLPDTLCTLTHLEQLAIGAARISNLPDAIDQLTSLVTLQLSGNTLTSLPSTIGALTGLATIELTDNRLTQLPAALCHLPRLATLRVSENRLTHLPEDLGKLSGTLVTLAAAANRITALPASITSLSTLQTLDLTTNMISTLPHDFGTHLISLTRLYLDDNQIHTLPLTMSHLTRIVEIGLSHNNLTGLPTSLLAAWAPTLGTLRIQSNCLDTAAMMSNLSLLTKLKEPPLLFDNTPSAEAIDLSDSSSEPSQQSGKPIVAILLPGLIRNYKHGTHWKRFVDSLFSAYTVRVYICVWSITGAVGNNFAQAADRARGTAVDVEELRRCYPAAVSVQLVDAVTEWVGTDSEGFDGRYINQWKMVQKCFELMEAEEEAMKGCPRSEYVIRARPDLRVACLPFALQRGGGSKAYLALQERLWGSDNFFFGDYNSMRTVCCGIAPKYDEYTTMLGQASSEPMMQRHIEEVGLEERVIRFARCVSVDRA